MAIVQRSARVNRDTQVTVPLYNWISIMYVVLILFVFFYLLMPLISIPCIVKIYVCIAPVTQIAAAECILNKQLKQLNFTRNYEFMFKFHFPFKNHLLVLIFFYGCQCWVDWPKLVGREWRSGWGKRRHWCCWLGWSRCNWRGGWDVGGTLLRCLAVLGLLIVGSGD